MKTNYEQIVDVAKIGQHSAADMNAIFTMAEQERFSASVDDSPKRSLLAIDVQKDFIEGGALAVPGSIGDVERITRFIYNNMGGIEVVNSIFEKMLELCNDISFIFQNYCFTILVCFETEDEFVVYSCGDGYIIKENEEGISFDILDDGEYPCYYIYNFITDKSTLIEYKDGVNFKVTRFAKTDYFNVGVASDGLRFAENLLDVERGKLMKFLYEGKGSQIEVLINRNNRKNEMFHDDISICF